MWTFWCEMNQVNKTIMTIGFVVCLLTSFCVVSIDAFTPELQTAIEDVNDYCPADESFIAVADSEVNADNDQVRAMQSLPEFLYVKQSTIPNAGRGVFTRVAIGCGTSFGPYKGDFVGKDGDWYSSGYSFMIHDDHYVDAGNESTSNWLRYVNCARTEDEQNLHAFEQSGEIHFVTYKTIAPNRELLIFYGAEYAEELGINKMHIDDMD